MCRWMPLRYNILAFSKGSLVSENGNEGCAEGKALSPSPCAVLFRRHFVKVLCKLRTARNEEEPKNEEGISIERYAKLRDVNNGHKLF